LLDEPTAALDPRSQSRVVDFLVEWGNGKKTVIVATHDLDTLSEIADDAYIFQNGKIVAHDTPTSTPRQPATLARCKFDS